MRPLTNARPHAARERYEAVGMASFHPLGQEVVGIESEGMRKLLGVSMQLHYYD